MFFSTTNLREIRKILGSPKREWTTKEVPNIQNLTNEQLKAEYNRYLAEINYRNQFLAPQDRINPNEPFKI